MDQFSCNPVHELFFEILREKQHVFCDAKDSAPVLELKRIVEGILKVVLHCLQSFYWQWVPRRLLRAWRLSRRAEHVANVPGDAVDVPNTSATVHGEP
ncbi:unnamed protein product [Heligmosomoides polygyrus]|uniref:Uncharacterized protein n=1 Tax=Heligmosomoides polygyrus TaxID=6339 RepID=A0A183G8G7_HELPZ|nr:unnamed protein product [Heligmosomoides polygyrus]